jgi:hypothetical protein
VILVDANLLLYAYHPRAAFGFAFSSPPRFAVKFPIGTSRANETPPADAVACQ